MRLIHKIIYICAILMYLSFMLVGLCGCERDDEPKKISLKDITLTPPPVSPSPSRNHLRVAIAAMVSPKETYVSYKELLNFIGEQSKLDVQLLQRNTYKEVNDLLRNNELDLAFVCTGAYIDGHDTFDMHLLVAPVVYGKTVYYSYIIVPKDSTMSSFDELKGKSFAFTDPMSNTGRLAPTYMLAQMNETPETFFGSTTYTYSHDKSIEAVARKLVNGAAVDSLVWDYLNKTNPEFTSKTKIIKKSDSFGIPPIVVSEAMDSEQKRTLQNLFLHMHESEKGRRILSKIMIDKFVEVDDIIYDSVRIMKEQTPKNVSQ